MFLSCIYKINPFISYKTKACGNFRNNM